MEALVNGIHLHYVQAGNGTPLLLIHGYPLDHTLWQPQVDGLANAARVIAPDLRGFGQSDAPGGVCTMETYTDDLRAPRTEVLGRYIAAHRLACLACDRRRLKRLPLGRLLAFIEQVESSSSFQIGEYRLWSRLPHVPFS